MNRTVMGYVLGAFLIGGAAWFYVNFERVTEREHVGLKGEASRNPLLALTRLMERMGLEAASVQRAEDLAALDARTTVILRQGRLGYATTQIERVVEWGEQGGHLIVEAEPVDDDDPLLDALDVSRKEGTGVREKPAAVTLPGAKPLRAHLLQPMVLVDGEPKRTRHVSSDAHGTHVLHFAHGRGRVTVLPSASFMTNDAIGENDHAELAWRLVQLAPETSRVVIGPRLGRPSLWGWLASEARAPVLGAALLLALWVWRACVRFGPVEAEPTRERRRLLEHLRASGRFLWRSGEASRLLAAARETCLQKIARTRPVLVDLPPPERAARLAALTGLQLRDIHQAFAGEPDTPTAFTAAVRTLQQIEEQLTRKLTV